MSKDDSGPTKSPRKPTPQGGCLDTSKLRLSGPRISRLRGLQQAHEMAAEGEGCSQCRGQPPGRLPQGRGGHQALRATPGGFHQTAPHELQLLDSLALTASPSRRRTSSDTSRAPSTSAPTPATSPAPSLARTRTQTPQNRPPRRSRAASPSWSPPTRRTRSCTAMRTSPSTRTWPSRGRSWMTRRACLSRPAPSTWS